jgi:hypothetical protein
MMEYDEFADRFLAALYIESEKHGKEYVRAETIIQKYSLELKPSWIGRMVDDWESSYFKNIRKVIGNRESWSFSLSAEGYRKVEDDFSLDINEIEQFLSPSDSDSESAAYELALNLEEDSSINSSNWTGLPSNFVLTEQKRDQLVTMLRNAEADLDSLGASNHEKAMARAYIVAAKTLADAPEPPTDLIWELVNRANQRSGIASLFVSIMALFASVAN